MTDATGRETKAKKDRAIRDKIGRELRAMYEDLLRQPVPENLTAPLRAIDEVQSSEHRFREPLKAVGGESRAVPPSNVTPLRIARRA
jgi:hypothetical protein